jgi:hypothetical protein
MLSRAVSSVEQVNKYRSGPWYTHHKTATTPIGINPGGRDPPDFEVEGGWGSWRMWFRVFYAVKGRDGNPGPPSFQTRLTPLTTPTLNQWKPAMLCINHETRRLSDWHFLHQTVFILRCTLSGLRAPGLLRCVQTTNDVARRRSC